MPPISANGRNHRRRDYLASCAFAVAGNRTRAQNAPWDGYGLPSQFNGNREARFDAPGKSRSQCP